MTLEGLNVVTGAILGVLGILVILVGWLRWLRPRIHRARADGVAIRDAILGREPVVDTITRKEILPALPGIGVRMAHQERQMERLTETVELLAKQQSAHQELERRVESIDQRVKRLEDTTVERIVNKAESTQALRVIETALRSDPPMDAESDEIFDNDPAS